VSRQRIWEFKRGYKIEGRWLRHESPDQYAALQEYIRMPKPRNIKKLAERLGYTTSTVWRWSRRFNWDERIAAYDKNELQIVHKESTELQRKQHKAAIKEYRESAERQAKDMLEVSEDLVRILGARIKQADATGEDIPINQVAGLLRATASIAEQGRQAWSAAIGVDQLMEVVEVELQNSERQREQKALEANEDDDGVFEFEVDE
jgi:DNA-binding MarR family transcriptional regulator